MKNMYFCSINTYLSTFIAFKKSLMNTNFSCAECRNTFVWIVKLKSVKSKKSIHESWGT